ncbi:MAG: TetR/AcrR family transcriptional regulator [Aquabacterium sp.]|uniref:TetR/AcrR family transcriptional regulator n=1 Tax=Aquabacterium sp. TaxID=1872578 RepID=UPI0025C32533|nr:TetR/AcrR family transcriptional regulator [Aquabacterium sp.]MBI5925474.1 TetR/AcrR family transcriptional regulator [Aquabacterium sp.]
MTSLFQGEALPTNARERILHTAHRLFYAHGIRATGIDKVIAEAGITKVTFYRHFPSKNELILAYLALRHERWMQWFDATLAAHGGKATALVPTLKAWFESDGFRGCAFINVVNELGEELPEVVAVSQAHKQDMTRAIAALLPASRQRAALAQALAMVVDGAIVQVQMTGDAPGALSGLQRVVKALMAPSEKSQ